MFEKDILGHAETPPAPPRSETHAPAAFHLTSLELPTIIYIYFLSIVLQYVVDIHLMRLERQS